MNPGTIDVSILIPVFNGGEVVRENVTTLVRHMSKGDYLFEVLCIDDGSHDSTETKLRSLSEQIGEVRYLRMEKNVGKGGALQAGVPLARGRFVLFTDADLAYPVDQIDAFVSTLEDEVDVVLANRRAESSRFRLRSEDFKYVYARHRVSGVLNAINRFLFFGDSDIHDSQAGLKAFRSDCARDLFSRLTIRDFGFDIELLYLARKIGYRIKSIPVFVDFGDSESSVTIVGTSWNIILDIARILLNRVMGKYGL